MRSINIYLCNIEKAEIEKQTNTLNNNPHTPECIVSGHLPHGNLFPVICCPIVSVKITIIIPIIKPKIAAPLVIQGNQTRPSKTINKLKSYRNCYSTKNNHCWLSKCCK